MTVSWRKIDFKFWWEPNFGGKFQGVGTSLWQKNFFIYIYIAHSFWKYKFFIYFLLAYELEKVFVSIVTSNKLTIVIVVSVRKLLGFSEKSLGN